MKRRLFGLVGLVILLSLAVGTVTQRQTIRDHYIVRTAAQQPESEALRQQLELTQYADFIYRASRPQIQSATTFNNSCKDIAREHSIVLGCYTRQEIFIYNVEDERLSGVKEVTAAHELLHAVYERMSSSEKKAINQELTRVADTIDDTRFKDTVQEYRRSEPDQVENELHSILGTEIAVLSTALESHYSKYFKDRQKIVSYAKQYEDAFTTLEKQMQSYDRQLRDLRERKEQLEDQLADQQQAIEANQRRLSDLRAADDREAYNAAVPGFNASIQSYNGGVAALKQIIDDYNRIVSARNALAATQNDLVKQLDSSYQPLE